jgi:hypothetical protein
VLASNFAETKHQLLLQVVGQVVLRPKEYNTTPGDWT